MITIMTTVHLYTMNIIYNNEYNDNYNNNY